MIRDETRIPRRAVDDNFVRAAGGVLLRTGESGEWAVALVHRPGRDDWSLPKGKLAPGETMEAGALREVEEETGLRCRLGRFVGYTEYIDRRGRPKVVAYWAMEVVEEGTFSAHGEIDDLQWVEVSKALEILTYGRDRDLLASVEKLELARSA